VSLLVWIGFLLLAVVSMCTQVKAAAATSSTKTISTRLGQLKPSKSTSTSTLDAKNAAPSQHTLPTRVSGYGSSGKHAPVTEGVTATVADASTSLDDENNRMSLRIHSNGTTGTLSLYSRTHNCTLGLEIADDGSLALVNDTLSTPQTTTATATESQRASWIPVEGLYGIYSIPSGKLVVWIQHSDTVYNAPAAAATAGGPSWWQIQKIAQLHICRIPNHRSLTRSQRQEEKRQVSLLRQSLKHHEWYYTTPGQGQVLPDMTHTLQRGMTWWASMETTATSNDTLVATPKWWNATAQKDSTTAVLRPDSRFFWNEDLLADIDTISKNSNSSTASHVLLDHVIPVTSAFCGVQTNLTAPSTGSGDNGTVSYDQLLITRRSRFRAGTRFTKRGADHSGAVANYAETEQVLLLHNNNNVNNSNFRTLTAVNSHVQTRGSIPLRWSSPTDLKSYRPRVRIGTDPLAQARAVRQHIADQAAHYIPTITSSGQQSLLSNLTTASTNTNRKHAALVFLNLVDKHSDQGRLGRALDAVLTAVLDVYKEQPDPEMPWLTAGNIQHIWFDFHAELKGGRWDRLVNLLEQLKPTLMEQGYFRAVPVVGAGASTTNNSDFDFSITRMQTGVTRTNCMDCLDRTNVVQSIFGRFLLFNQLADDKSTKLSLASKTAFRKKPMTIPWLEGEVAHRMLWADNADAISFLYAGTNALKGDFTRTGKRTKKGALDDGMNSMQRYYLNNFLDADRQEGMDILIGHQPFSYWGDDADDESTQAHSPGLPSRQAMTIQQAARQMMMGTWPEDEYSQDDSDHVRIKVKTGKVGKLSKLPEASGGELTRRPLDLRWLPGDLQTQVRSLASISLDELPHEFSSGTALRDIDQRSASDLPWWVSEASSDSEDADTMSSVVADIGSAASNNAGYLLGAMVAAAQAPVAMAVIVLGLAGLVSFPKPKEEDR
jgi:hypothetical protein